jgi:Flp pilus assembly protein TadD
VRIKMNRYAVGVCGWAFAAALALGIAGCQSDHAATPKASKQSAAKMAEDAKAQDAFETGAGKPPTPATMYSLARILQAKGNTAQAIGVLRNLIQRYPDYSPAYNALAEAYMSADRTDDARSALIAGVTRSPKDPVLLNNLGMVYFMQGDYESALAYFDRAVAVVPSEPTYTSNKAAALGMLGRVADAAELYRKHLRKADVMENIDVLVRARRIAATPPPAASSAAQPALEAGVVESQGPATQPSAPQKASASVKRAAATPAAAAAAVVAQ